MISKRLFSTLFVALSLATPWVSAAQGRFSNLTGLIDNALEIAYIVLAIIFVLALVVFSWGVVKYISAAGDAAKLKEARPFLWWGIIGIFVLAAMWGIIVFIGQAVGIDDPGGGELQVPSVEVSP